MKSFRKTLRPRIDRQNYFAGRKCSGGKGLLPSENTNPWVPAAGQGVKLNCYGGTCDSSDVVDLVAPEYTTPAGGPA
jgi:hypothetical protein